jgi:hypothetical protein
VATGLSADCRYNMFGALCDLLVMLGGWVVSEDGLFVKIDYHVISRFSHRGCLGGDAHTHLQEKTAVDCRVSEKARVLIIISY